MKRSSWLDSLATHADEVRALSPQMRQSLSTLDDVLFGIWDLGNNIILAWTREVHEYRFLAERHYVSLELFGANPVVPIDASGAGGLLHSILAGPMFV